MSDGGKGDKRRPTDEQKFRDNYELVFGRKQSPQNSCADFGRCNCLAGKCDKSLDKSKKE